VLGLLVAPMLRPLQGDRWNCVCVLRRVLLTPTVEMRTSTRSRRGAIKCQRVIPKYSRGQEPIINICGFKQAIPCSCEVVIFVKTRECERKGDHQNT